MTQFDTIDIQAAAESLLGCVQSCGQRYGTTVILDTVHGANTVKIRNYRMDENPHYGELAKESVVHLRQMFNFLQVEEYLFVTADEYSIVKLTEKVLLPGSTGANRDEDGEGAGETGSWKQQKEPPGREASSRGSRIYGEGRDALRGTPRAAPRDRIRGKKCRRISYSVIKR